MNPISVKLVIVGDGAVGKTSMLLRYSRNTFPKEYEPTIFENSIVSVKINNQIVNLGLWDTAGQQQFAKIRPLAYSNVDIFLIVFSIDDPNSLKNAIKKWYPEVNGVSPYSIKHFVGNKIDLRQKPYYNQKLISRQEGQQAIRKMGCIYSQCSALTREGIVETFQRAVRDAIHKTAKLQQACPGCQLI